MVAATPQEQEAGAIDLDRVDPDALKVVRRLGRFGFETYLVGGCVRDLLIGCEPKDFDVATSATPTEIKKLFRNCRIIGRRFRLAHIFFGGKIIETSTFRARPEAEEEGEENDSPIIRRDNIFGTAETDAQRRDFTINGLFYDVKRQQVIDHVQGLADLEARRIRTIDEPRVRVQEDPVRILRAVKFATRLGFTIEPATRDAFVEFRGLIAECSVARVLEELYRLLGGGHAAPAFRLMHELGVLPVLTPELDALFEPPADPLARAPVPPLYDPSAQPQEIDEVAAPRDQVPQALRKFPAGRPEATAKFTACIESLHRDLFGGREGMRERAAALTWRHLEALDERVAAGAEPPTHAVMLGAMLMGLVSSQMSEQPVNDALALIERLVKEVSQRLRVSRKDRERLKQILVAQRRMVQRGRRIRPASLVRRDYFPEAWDLFQIWCAATGDNAEDLERWQQQLGLVQRQHQPRRRRRPRRNRNRNKSE